MLTLSQAEVWNGASMRQENIKRHMRRFGPRFGAPWDTIAMILGFVVFWPVGLAILFWKLWKGGRQGRVAMPNWIPNLGPHVAATRNSAFEAWKDAELERFEEERRKLAAVEQEFADFLTKLKSAKDKEEFERFRAARETPAQG